MNCQTVISEGASRCVECSSIARRGTNKEREKKDVAYTKCGHCYRPKRYYGGKTNCKTCVGMLREDNKIEWPPIQELQKMVAQQGYSKAGRELGVSDNAVRKHIRSQLALEARRKEFGYPGY